jgi:predicted PurR-regulated permease PerM
MGARPALTLLALASIVLLAAVGFPLWKPLLIAAVLAGTLVRPHDRLAHAVGSRRSLSAALVTIGVVLIIVVPLVLIGLLVVKEALALIAFIRHAMSEKGMSAVLAPLPDWLETWANHALDRLSQQGRDFISAGNVLSRTGWAFGVAAGLLGSVWDALFTLALMLVALFFLLRDGHHLVRWLEGAAPLGSGQLRAVLAELRRVSRSVIGAQLATGFIQAATATIGYATARVPSPIFFGVVTLAASFIPSVGTAAVGLPLAGFLWLMGHGGWAVFLAAWTLLVSGLVDNLVRPLLVKGGTDLHSSLIFFSLLGGILAFGPMGLILGPLSVGLFLSVVAILRREKGEPS